MSSINLINGGLDVQGIVDNLIAVERTPITNLQSRTQAYQSKITAYQSFNTKLLALKTSAESFLYNGEDVPLTVPADFSARLDSSLLALRKATSSDENVVTASADKGDVTGNFTVTVSRLAKYNSYASANLASDTTTLTKTGTLVIQKGAEDPVTITIDGTNNTLQGIRNAINQADAGFTANILNDGSGTPYRLVVTSSDSGSAGALTITDNLDQGAGSDLSFTQTTPADNAEFEINGISLTSSSNRVTDVIEGVTFNLKSESTAPVFVTLERDIDSMVAGIKDLVSKYNDVISFISVQSKYNTTTKSAGILSGDFTLRQTQADLSTAFSRRIDSDGSSLTLLSQIGIKLGNNGLLSVDEAKLQNALSGTFADTAHLLLADATDAGGSTVSLVPMLQDRLRHLTDSLDGPVSQITSALQQNITQINRRIDQMEARLDVRRDLLIAQYSQADEALRQLSILQSSLENQLSSLSSLT